jgi:hypothetical protein
VLVVYYTYTQQTLKVAEAMADALRPLHVRRTPGSVAPRSAQLLGQGRERGAPSGSKIPASNLQPGYQEQARAFANELADGLDASRSERESAPSSMVAEAHAGMGG